MGTPEFAVPSLEILIQNNYQVKGVVTTPDKPAGRGQKVSQSAVKQYALSAGLRILQPENLKDPGFIHDLMHIHADLQIVVAFRMLPEIVWSMPVLGTFNLHASLLPQYRGAAPINRAVMNGETKTGLTTFFLKHAIDTGNIILQDEELINPDDNAGSLHDRLMVKGAQLVLKTVQMIESGNITAINQADLVEPGIPLKTAPKILKQDCRINFNQPAEMVRNFIRGLSPYPGAYFEMESPDHEIIAFKVFDADVINGRTSESNKIIIENRSNMLISCVNSSILIKEIQISGKKRMKTADFLLGHSLSDTWRIIA